MALLSIDIGTTHCKAGLFDMAGQTLRIASRPTVSHQSASGLIFYDPQGMILTIAEMLQELTMAYPQPIQAVGIASMAESGLLLHRRTGTVESPFLPWFETNAQATADWMKEQFDAHECYLRFGMTPSFKASLTKILWLRHYRDISTENVVWLSAADYLAYWLTGQMSTDPSLAGRTLAYRVDQRRWDTDWLAYWKLPVDVFPAVLPSGAPLGEVQRDMAGLKKGTPVAICGHDHLCAALATGAIHPNVVFDSMGTAETLLGALAERALTQADYENGLLYGCHVVAGMGYWMGSLSSSGGSIEWVRKLVQPMSPSYADFERLLKTVSPRPTGILYFPYLLGSGSPHTDPRARAAFIGLSQSHQSGDIFKAVLEGTAFEMEYIRQAGEKMTGKPIATLVAAGGGTRYQGWMQIKADISGCRIDVADESEATLLGAAMAAALGQGLFATPTAAFEAMGARASLSYWPDPTNHAAYQDLYQHGYLPLQDALRQYTSPKPPLETA